MTRAARQAGVTLAELTVVLSILVILATFALPAGLDGWRRETVAVLADRFASAASLARATARNQRVWVHLGPRDAASGWAAGWALYTAATPRMQATPVAPGMDDVLITVSPPTVPSVDFAFTASQKGVDTLSYAPVGYSRTSNGAPLSGTLTIASGAHVRRVRINFAGRVRVCNPATDRSCGTGDDS